MLGFELKRCPVKGKFAHEIREQMRRIRDGHLNNQDIKIIEQEKSISKKAVVKWK